MNLQPSINPLVVPLLASKLRRMVGGSAMPNAAVRPGGIGRSIQGRQQAAGQTILRRMRTLDPPIQEDSAGRGQSKVNALKAPLVPWRKYDAIRRYFDGSEAMASNDHPVGQWWQREIKDYLRSKGRKKTQKLRRADVEKEIAMRQRHVGKRMKTWLQRDGYRIEGSGDLLGAIASGHLSITEAVERLLGEDAGKILGKLKAFGAPEGNPESFTGRMIHATPHGEVPHTAVQKLVRRPISGVTPVAAKVEKAMHWLHGSGKLGTPGGRMAMRRLMGIQHLTDRITATSRKTRNESVDEGLGSFIRKAKRVGRAGAFMAGLTGPMVGLGAWNAGRDRMPAHVLRAASERAEVIKSFKMPDKLKGLRRSKNIEVRPALTLQQMRDMGDRASWARVGRESFSGSRASAKGSRP